MMIQPIFAQPVFVSKLENISDQEVDFINKQKKSVFMNKGGNYYSQNSNILREKEMELLLKKIQEKVSEYFDKIVCTIDDIKPYITQSWLNWTHKGEGHHTHTHSNSYISGVYYVSCKKNDSIIFEKPQEAIQFENFEKFNIFNMRSWECPVENNTLILFPSLIRHGVKINESNHTRITLAFNVFIKGTIGAKNTLTELEVK